MAVGKQSFGDPEWCWKLNTTTARYKSPSSFRQCWRTLLAFRTAPVLTNHWTPFRRGGALQLIHGASMILTITR